MAQQGSSRRRVLRATVGGVVAGLAGCLGSGSPGGASNATATQVSLPDGPWKGNAPQFQYDAAHTGSGTAPGPSGEVSEHFAVPMDVDGVGLVKSPAVVDGVAYVTMGGSKGGSDFSMVAAYDVRKGELIWKDRFEGSNVSGTPTTPAVEGSTLYVGVADKLYAYNVENAERKWGRKHTFASDTHPTVTGDHVLVEDNSDLYAVDAKSGKQVWKYTPDTSDYGVFVNSPSASESTVFVCANRLEAVDPSTGNESWTASLDSGAQASPTVGTNAVYVGTSNGTVYAFPHEGGKQYWKRSISSYIDGIDTSVAIGDGTVVARTGPYSDLKAINADDGSTRWSAGVSSQGPPVISDGTVYVRQNSGMVALNHENGKELWRYEDPVSGGELSAPVVSGNYAFFVRGKRELVVLKGSG